MVRENSVSHFFIIKVCSRINQYKFFTTIKLGTYTNYLCKVILLLLFVVKGSTVCENKTVLFLSLQSLIYDLKN